MFIIAWRVKEERLAETRRQQKREGGEVDRVSIAPGVTARKLRRFREALVNTRI